MYNPTFESIYSIVPSVPALLLLLIPAILMTVASCARRSSAR
jgi:ribosome-dependent ATPase